MSLHCHKSKHSVRRLVNDGVEVLFGPPDIIANRTQVRSAALPSVSMPRCFATGALVPRTQSTSRVRRRLQVELGWLGATAQVLVPQGICNRYVNFTAHPSQTPGAQLRVRSSEGPIPTAALPSRWRKRFRRRGGLYAKAPCR